MRGLKWQIAAVLALLPMVFGQLSPVMAADSAPTANTYPLITSDNDLVSGNTLAFTPPDWSGTPAPTVTTQWYSCSSQVALESELIAPGCAPISGATAAGFALTNAQKAKFIMVGSFATNAATGNVPVSRYSATTISAIAAAPALKATALGANSSIRVNPTGNAALNSKLTVDLTGWVTAQSYQYRWYRCDDAISAGLTAPGSCVEISGATGSSYVVTNNDVDKVLTSFVTAKNASTELASVRIASDVQVQQTPVNTLPAVLFSGTVVVGSTITAMDGGWSASPRPTFAYQWYSCKSAVPAAAVKNAKCSAIAGETFSNYVVAPSLNNKYLVVQVKATNTANTGSPVSSFSASSSKVLTAPANTVAPKVAVTQSTATGAPIGGTTLNVVAGTWTGNPAPAKTYQWFSCDTAVPVGLSVIPLDCDPLAGATGTSFVTSSSMHGKFVAVEETATNLAGITKIITGSTNSIQTKPVFANDPTVSGNANSGATLTVSSGASAFGGATSESFAWAKCSTQQVAGAAFAAGCAVISGETQATLNVGTELEGYFLVARVTLTNTAGQTTRTSASTQQVLGSVANVSIAKPNSTKNFVQLGFAVTANDGVWSGFPQPTFEYEWYRCVQPQPAKSSELPTDCVLIPNATLANYVPVSADSGKYLSVRVTGVQGIERVSVWSPTSYQVLEAPSFSGNPAVGTQHVVGGPNLLAVAGVIRGVSEPRLDFAWYRCSAPTASSMAVLPLGCALIAGANDASYPFTPADVGKYVLASITMTNELGSVKKFTSSSQLVNVAPVNLTMAAPVSASLPAKVGVQLTAGADTWNGNPSASFSYQWYRCDSQLKVKTLDLPAGCIGVGGQTLETYTPTSLDAGKYLLVGVRGFNEHGSQTVYSPSSADIAEQPQFMRGPILNNLRDKGKQLEVLVAELSGWPAPVKSYRWFRCDSVIEQISTAIPAGCAVIAGATQSTYTLQMADVQKYVLPELKIKNSVGQDIKYAASSMQVRQIPELADTLTVTGNQWVDQTLTLNGISVAGFPTPTTSIEWLRCAPGTTNFNQCLVVMTGANTYKLALTDRESQIVVRVTARNEAGVTRVVSAPTGAIKYSPKLIAGSYPIVVGLDTDGEARAATVITAYEGAWDASPEVNLITGYQFQWYLCSAQHPVSSTIIPPDCTAIKNQVTRDYLVKFTDKEKFLGFSVKVSNGTEDMLQFSATTARVYVVPLYASGAKPSFALNQSATDGSPRVGYEIEATVGTWQGSPTPTYSYQWFSCTTAVIAPTKDMGENCQEIFNATNRVLTITPDLVGKFLGVYINGKYKVYSDALWTATTAKTVVSPPVNSAPPRITSRYSYVQSTLKTTEGTWTGTPEPTQVHSWWECDLPLLTATSTQPTFCRELANSSGNWKITEAQNGKYLASLATATNTAGSTKFWSATTAQITTGSVNLKPPTISVVAPATPFTGSQLASTLVSLKISDSAIGDWVGTPTPDTTSNEYSWYRCTNAVKEAGDLLNGACQLIELNATGQTYRPIGDDVGKFLVASVKNDNGVGASLVYTVSTEAILQPPNNTIAPAIAGKAFVDQPVTAVDGTWEGFPVPTNKLQWLACDSQQLISSKLEPANCAVIDKATTATFTPTDDLLRKFLVLRTVATNSVGEQTVWSASTTAVVSGPVKKKDPKFTYPATTATPITRLNPIVGQEMSTDGGEWKGVSDPLKSYEWWLCPTALVASVNAPAEDKKCEVIPAETGDKITPAESARGKFLMVHVHAVNENGEADFYSATTTVVWMAPVVDHVVVASGTAFHRLTVKAKLDTWKAFPDVTKTYEWFVCSTPTVNATATLPAGCQAIASATANKYKIPDAPWHLNEYLIVKIRATNSVSFAEHYSATSEKIQTGPVNERSPAITGSTLFASGVNVVLTGNAGLWSPIDSSLSYQWYQCATVLVADDELDPGCTAIQGANALTYQLNDVDPGKSLMIGVTGEHGNLRSTAYSASTALVTEKVRNVTAPSISGVPKVNEISTGLDGDWRGFPAVVKTKSWYSCTTRLMASVVAATTTWVPPTCKLLSGAVGDSLTNDAADIGRYLVYAVSATNRVSSATPATTVKVFSAATDAVADPPVFDGRPSLERPTGTAADAPPKVGSVWKAKAAWTNKVAPTPSYEWYRCDAPVDTVLTQIIQAPAGCVAISASNDVAYTIRIDDQNKFLMVSVTGTNAAGAVTEFSNTSDLAVAQAPSANPLPSISGNHTAGSTLTIDPGVWTPSSVVLTYNWFRCTGAIPATTSEQPPNQVGGNVCTKIAGNGLTHVVDELENGTFLTAQVVATNFSAITSYLIGVTEGVSQAPVNSTPPTAKGDAYLVGLILSAAYDDWIAMPAPTKTYQWYGCSSLVLAASPTLDSSCTAIPNATDINYQLERDHTGEYILVSVTARNSAGSATIFSGSTQLPVEAGYSPGNTSVTTSALNGITQITEASAITFSQTAGTWTHGNDTFQPITNRRWIFCSEPILAPTAKFPSTCDFVYDYAGAQKKLNALEAQDLTLGFDTDLAGYYIGLVEYVLKPNSNPLYDTNRQAFRLSKTSDRVTIAPRLWIENPGYVEPKVTLAPIVGTASSISQVSEWQNDTNSLSLAALSRVTWRGAEAGTYSYQWFTCVTKQTALSLTGLASGCVELTGATASTYTPTGEDVRAYLGVKITATNSAGSATVWTKTGEKITQRPTVVAGSEPTLNAITLTQDVATVSAGVWQGEPAPTFTYKWMLCGPGAPAQITSATTPAMCSVISGNNIYPTSTSIVVPTLSGKNVDKKLVVQVIATNKPFFADPNLTAETLYSVSSVSLKEKPYFASADPVLLTSSPTTNVLAPNVGETLTMVNDQGKWFATPVESAGLTFSYTWYTCGLNYPTLQRTESINSDCVAITGETSRSISLTRALSGTRILGKITATSNDPGWTTSVSGFATSATQQIREKPYSTRIPSLSVASGTQPQVGVKVQGDPGDWGGFPQPQVDSNSYQWYMCNDAVAAGATLKAGCSLIQTPTSNSSFTPSSAQAGKYLVFSPLASNIVNPNVYSSDRQYSAGFGPTLMAPEITFASPATTGILHVGQTLSTTMPSVRAYPTPTSTTFEWYHCTTNSGTDSNTSVPLGCVKIGDTNQTTITIDDSMAGRYIEIYAVSTNSVKTVRKNTFGTKYVTKSPTNDAPPTISGTTLVNGTNKFSSVAGRWSAYPSVSTYTYNWLLCQDSVPAATSTKPANCSAAPGANSSTVPTELLLVREMSGKFLVLEEIATQASNNLDLNKQVKIYSASSTEIRSAPLFETESTISGFRHLGEELVASVGTISGFPVPSPIIQWYSCTSAVTSKISLVGFGCSAITGANSGRYTLTTSEIDRFVTYGVTATNSVSAVSAFATSGSSKVTQSPTIVTAPALRGDSTVGTNKTITVTGGTWAGTATITKTINWYSCDTEKTLASNLIASDCSKIVAAGGLAVTSNSLTLTSEHRGKFIVAVEIATNTTNKPGTNQAQQVTSSIGPITMAPQLDATPSFSGVLHVGETLSATLPTATAYPAANLSYDWWACSSALTSPVSTLPATCSLLTGLSDANLQVTTELAGKFIAVAVTASNAFGTVTKSSNALVDVTQSPINISGPVITGSAVVDATLPLLVSNGTWTSSPAAKPSDFGYNWYQCSQAHPLAPSSLPADCTLLSSQTSSTLAPTNAMAGKYLLAKVTLTVRSNKAAAGMASVFSASTDSVLNSPQFSASAPTISGVVHSGETLTATLIQVSGNEIPTSSYQWWSCTDVVAAGATDITANCSALPGSNDANLLITSALVGKRIAVLQTATNNQGVASKSSASTAVVTSTPAISAAPVISGSDIYSSAASSATVSTGTWVGYPAPTSSNYSYAWYSCAAAVTSSSTLQPGCSIIANATSSAVPLTAAMVGKHLVAKVSATTTSNKVGAGTGSTFTASFGPIRVGPSNSVAPSFTPTSVAVGRSLVASVGTWVGTGPISTSYRWWSCPSTATISATVPVPTTCSQIAGYDNINLVVPQTSATKKILLAVTATNSVGSVTKSAISAASVTAASLSPLALRAIL
jgi:hypothetical protein